MDFQQMISEINSIITDSDITFLDAMIEVCNDDPSIVDVPMLERYLHDCVDDQLIDQAEAEEILDWAWA